MAQRSVLCTANVKYKNHIMVPFLQEDFDETKYKVKVLKIIKYFFETEHIFSTKFKLNFLKVIIKLFTKMQKRFTKNCILQKPPFPIVSTSIYSKLV